MKRNVSLAEISDGRLYKASDMVKADCGGCNGCSRCCHGMGNSIILDPYDVYRMTTGMGKSMQELLAASVELNVVDGVILPNLKMQGTKEACAYLDEEGRCSIHPHPDKRRLPWSPALIWMRKEDVASIRTGLESAGCFRWEDIMKTEDFPIFSRPGNVRRRTAAR